MIGLAMIPAGSREPMAPAGDTDPRRQAMIDRLANWIRSRGLNAPAILFLEISKPLAPVGGQALLLLQPLIGSIGPFRGGDGEDQVLAEYAALLEDPVSIDQILARLERPDMEKQ